ncbi:MAG: PepSY domain-containing protein [Nitrospira sp.]|nr:MAG: PepSY domain-containing protein [Nitrospira sp.]
MGNTPSRAVFFTLHQWVGLVVGLFVISASLTGSALVYWQELDHWWNHDRLTVTPTGTPLPLDELARIARTRHPDATGMIILWFPTRPDDSYEFRLYFDKHDYGMDGSAVLNLDPYSGTVLRDGSHRDPSHVMQWLLTFHYSVHLGLIGVLWMGLITVAVGVSLVTGIWLYRKHFLSVVLCRKRVHWANWRTAAFGLHGIAGVWTLFFVAAIFFSGFLMNRTAFDPETWATRTYQPAPATGASVGAMLAQSRDVFPGFVVRSMYIPFVTGDTVRVSGDVPGTSPLLGFGASAVAFDPLTGEVVERIDINHQSMWTKFETVAYAFHIGTFAGEPSRLLYVFVGLAPALMAMTGFVLWWKR